MLRCLNSFGSIALLSEINWGSSFCLVFLQLMSLMDSWVVNFDPNLGFWDEPLMWLKMAEHYVVWTVLDPTILLAEIEDQVSVLCLFSLWVEFSNLILSCDWNWLEISPNGWVCEQHRFEKAHSNWCKLGYRVSMVLCGEKESWQSHWSI